MSIKKTTLATMILLSLTACHHHTRHVENPADPKLRNQVTQLTNQLKAQENKTQTTQNNLSDVESKLNKALAAQKAAEDKLKNTPNNAQLQKDLTNAKNEVAKLQNQLKKEVDAVQEKNKTVADLEKKLADTNPTLSREEVLAKAVAVGLPSGWATELADDMQNKPLADVQRKIDLTVKSRTLRLLAMSYGLDNQAARAFQRANMEKSFDEAEAILAKQQEEREKAQREEWEKQQAEWNKRNELYNKLSGIGVYGSEADEFVNTYLNSDEQETALNRLIAEKEEASRLENKRNNLRDQFYDVVRLSYGELANTFVEQYLNATEDEIETKLTELKEIKDILEAKFNGTSLPYSIQDQFLADNLFKTATEQDKALADLSAKNEAIISQAMAKGLDQTEARNFAYSYFNNTDAERATALERVAQEKVQRENSRAELTAMAEEAGLFEGYFPFGNSNYYGQLDGFVSNNLGKSKAAAKIALDNLLKDPEVKKGILAKYAKELGFELYQYYGIDIGEIIDQLSTQELSEAKAELVKRKEITSLISEANVYRGSSSYEFIRAFVSNYLKQDISVAVAEVERLKQRYEFVKIYLAKFNIDLAKNSSYLANIDYHLEDNEAQLNDWIGITKGQIVNINHNDYSYGDYSSDTTKIYAQEYSTVVGRDTSMANGYDGSLTITTIEGTETKVLPQEGRANYVGKAFIGIGANTNDEGSLSYDVNFTERKGSGTITGIERYGDVLLNEAPIVNVGIAGTATSSSETGNYELKFYGPNAEEVAGKASFGEGKDIGFGGTRGEIQK
ncbi:factor H binding protein domain-containing protein [Conservatibacter flavescens]|uniref:Factor H binding protein-like C-terminal domain-containing protein n=1 Tax=Conservatibacter flavescens TaxID=28161 RepID=A0A2M8S213_9PAST|nr:factor H binding protein domain-containing protein [Conservatibacter flavescens]PJG85136.1 hypothetical protein CVP05_07725 [Conservatibacter flavescens]